MPTCRGAHANLGERLPLSCLPLLPLFDDLVRLDGEETFKESMKRFK